MSDLPPTDESLPRLCLSPEWTSIAAPVVFATYELCELILLELPMEELYVLQRVNHAWHDTIARSQDLQKKLFRTPSEAPLRPLALMQVRKGHPSHYYLGHNLFPYLSPVHGGQYLKLNPTTSASYTIGRCEYDGPRAMFPDHTEAHLPQVRPRPFTFHIERRTNEGHEDFLEFSVRHQDIALLRQSSTVNVSWRSMLFTQPPVTAVLLRTPLGGGEWRPRMTLYNAHGITFGDIIDCLQTEVLRAEFSKRGSHFGLVFGQMMLVSSNKCRLCRWVKHMRDD